VSWSNFTPFAPGGVEIFHHVFSEPHHGRRTPVWSSRNIVAATAVDGQVVHFLALPEMVPLMFYVAWQRFPADNNDNIGFLRGPLITELPGAIR